MTNDGRWAVDIWRAAMAPEPRLKVSEWADRHRILPRNSAEPGPWRTSRVPYLREIMDALSVSSPVERVVVMAGAQVGKTEAGLNWIGYCIAHAPGPMLLVQPSADMIRRNTMQRIDPMIECCPTIRNKVVEQKGREAGNTMSHKEFPGGALMMTTAGSGTGLRSSAVRYLFMDEVDAYPFSVDDEGDPVSLATQRTVTFRGRRKIYLCSTPTVKGLSRIEAAFFESDQRYFHVPCPACGDFAPIEWAQIRWPEGHRERAYRVCPACGGVAEERDKFRMLAGGKWVATTEGDGRTAGFRISTLYSPFETWGEVAAEHGRATDDPARLQTWVNNKLAETWEDQGGEAVDADPLMSRREDWGDLLPAAVALLTAGVDVQGDRLEVQVIGWGKDEESWVVDYRIIWGDPSGPRVWDDLDAFLRTTYQHSRNLPDVEIRAVCLDTGGHHTKTAYEFCRQRLNRRIWGIKGKGGPGIPVWPRRASKGKGGNPVFLVGVDALKDSIFARLRKTEPGPGTIHFHADRDAQYFAQLTAEKVITRYSKGRPQRLWVPKRDGERNEALDTFVYAMAALHGLMSMGLQLNVAAAALLDAPMRDAVAPGTPPTAPKPQPRIFKSSWMNR